MNKRKTSLIIVFACILIITVIICISLYQDKKSKDFSDGYVTYIDNQEDTSSFDNDEESTTIINDTISENEDRIAIAKEYVNKLEEEGLAEVVDTFHTVDNSIDIIESEPDLNNFVNDICSEYGFTFDSDNCYVQATVDNDYYEGRINLGDDGTYIDFSISKSDELVYADFYIDWQWIMNLSSTN